MKYLWVVKKEKLCKHNFSINFLRDLNQNLNKSLKNFMTTNLLPSHLLYIAKSTVIKKQDLFHY